MKPLTRSNERRLRLLASLCLAACLLSAVSEGVADRKQGTSAPLLALDFATLTLPGGTSKTIALRGTKAADASIECSDEQVLKVKKVEGGLLLTALSAGKATVTASVSGTVKSVVVEVRPYAAYFPQQIEAFVTGAPATRETVLGSIEEAVHNRLKAEFGTDMKLLGVAATEIGTGASKTFYARVKAFGTDSVTSEGQVVVTVRNEALPKREEAALWYCNSPESVKNFGALFSARLEPDEPVRLLYHHENASRKIMILKVQAVNDSNMPARLVITPGDGKPDANPVLAGYKAADQFVRAWRWSAGEIMTIPPHHSLPISLRRLYPGQTASGLCSLRLLDGPPSLLVRADAREPFALDSRWSSALRSSAPWREVGTQHIREFDAPARTLTEQIYPNPYIASEATYEVGKRFAFIRIGQKPIARRDKLETLDGNFGVLYKIKAFLSNPTSRPADVELVYEASAGYSGALVLLDGNLFKTPLLKPKAECRLLKLRLLPGASREVNLTTIPMSGGSYPATIAIRPIGSAAKYSATKVAERE